ncbi:MAG: ribonuclease E/G [Rhizobiales bacterium]|nr:ribonuclease E/G [Hyphomicrobiales bacterium]
MGSKMLIDATHAEETRVVVVRGTRIEEFDFESASRRQLKGNIYLAKVTRVEPSLQAAFVEYGGNRHGFLAFSEIHPDYYQIPVADRQALLREQEEEDAAHRDDDDNGHDNHRSRGRSRSREEPLASDHHEPSTSEDATSAHDEQGAESGDGTDEDTGQYDDDGQPAAEAAPAPKVERGIPGELGNGIEVVDQDAESQKIESIGAEDALEEVPRRQQRTPRRHYKIQEVIKRRQVILVQVVKEERGNKGAALTTFLSLAGRYCVLMPNTARGGGISRKITDAGDRRRLKDVTRDIEIPQGMGLIVRTAGAERTKTEIKRDYDYLIRLWESVRDLTLSSTAPALVYEEGNLIKRAIRDLYGKDVDEVNVEGDAAYREAKDFMKMLMPSHAKNVKLYKDTRPLFSRFQVESQLDSLYSPTVTLPSGGYMVMNQTEALVAVDINSGKATREHNIEDTALKTNLEASDEIARQLRLRDLAGLIVVDFIDMEENRNNRSVERRIKEALKNDRARIQVGRISHFGLLEMSRQRLRPGLLEGSSRTCPHCEGRGIVRSVSSCGLSVLRAIEEHLIARKAENLTVKCHREVASYILNEKRDNLLLIETSYGISVFIVPSDEVKGSQAVIERAGDRVIAPRKVQAAPIRMDSAFADNEDAEEDIVAEAAEDEAADTDSKEETSRSRDEGGSQDGGRAESQTRRRRRGRRGGRNGRDRDDSPARPEARAGIPGLGEQPGLDDTAAEQDTEAVVSSGTAAGGNGDGSRSRGRRDRGGRNRDRGRGGRGRSPGEEDRHPPPDMAELRAEPPVHADAETSPVRQEAPPPRLAPAEETAVQETEPRKWQPPQPTRDPVVTERKTGWWSKR